ncbi:membrane protein insertase YidC [Hydrogenovibrio halophilus]|uniref:membrane protein insertase YidC n=1 Tax=Hydrogenovibrio halophilus TaxID=373391 RepID=UPI00039B0F82|nr:membrane protein insertase YidC [Hydrogenovibrio halophilus]
MNMRTFWWLALAFTLLWLWMEWAKFQHAQSLPTQTQSQSQTTQAQADSPDAPQGSASTDAPLDVPTANDQATDQPQDVPTAQEEIAKAQRIHVKTDVLDLTLDTQGGDIREVFLQEYAASNDRDKPFQLMGDSGQMMYVAQNGLATQSGANLPAPTHRSVYQAKQTRYEMQGDSLDVPMTWEQDGIKVTKTYHFTRGEYVVDVSYQVENNSQQEWAGSLYSQLKRNKYDPDHSALMYTYTGPALYDGNAEDRFVKHSFDDLESAKIEGKQVNGGWAAMIQHYFMSAVIPDQDAQNRFFAKPVGNGEYVAGVVEPMSKLAPGETATLNTELYMGPIIQKRLEDIAPGLEMTVDYGIFTLISEPIFWVLDKIHSLVGNWGWSIIILTILIKLLFYKLSETSYRSMAKLKKFQPKLKQLKENYGDDKALFQQKMMKLYKEEKINPLGGCLPILVQMPVFIALYWVLLYSAEMRQAPWILWIDDLSTKDPYFILPILMGISMWVQQKLNPSAMMDEMQQKVMKALPFIFTVFFMFFPAGLVLYWVVNNILSVAQQWYITRKIEAGEEK